MRPDASTFIADRTAAEPTRERVPAPTLRRHGVRIAFTAAVFACPLLTACAWLDRSEMSELRPIGPDRFLFVAQTGLFRTSDPQGRAEAERLGWLREWLDLHAMCPAGYRILTRDAAVLLEAPIGVPIEAVSYKGQCR
jgi:hypothetical protein